MPNIGTYLIEKAYLRQYNKYSNCNPIPSTIQTFFAVGSDDLLKISTANFLQQSGMNDELVEYSQADHTFYVKYNNNITQQYYEDVGNFIKL